MRAAAGTPSTRVHCQAGTGLRCSLACDILSPGQLLPFAIVFSHATPAYPRGDWYIAFCSDGGQSGNSHLYRIVMLTATRGDALGWEGASARCRDSTQTTPEGKVRFALQLSRRGGHVGPQCFARNLACMSKTKKSA